MSDNENQEVKPEGPQHVSLKIKGPGFPELVIKVKKTTKLSKMMTAYCERAGKTQGEVRFMYDGSKLQGHMTVSDLDIDEDEGEEVQIDVTQEAVGGSL
ncbi:hypothetical protein JCM6882_001597 [Rhodosporidiobolus microsporus]